MANLASVDRACAWSCFSAFLFAVAIVIHFLPLSTDRFKPVGRAPQVCESGEITLPYTPVMLSDGVTAYEMT